MRCSWKRKKKKETITNVSVYVFNKEQNILQRDHVAVSFLWQYISKCYRERKKFAWSLLYSYIISTNHQIEQKNQSSGITRSTYSDAISTNLGPMRWHGPHHDAVKSTATNFAPEFWMIASNSDFVATTFTIWRKLQKKMSQSFFFIIF